MLLLVLPSSSALEPNALGLQPQPNPAPNLLTLGNAVTLADPSQAGREIVVDPEVPHLAWRHLLIVNNIVYECNGNQCELGDTDTAHTTELHV